jgi:hypothetical protein
MAPSHGAGQLASDNEGTIVNAERALRCVGVVTMNETNGRRTLCPPMEVGNEEVVRKAVREWIAVKRGKTREIWKTIGWGALELRKEAMHRTGDADHNSGGYAKVFSSLLKESGLRDMNDRVLRQLLEFMENLEPIEIWLGTLDTNTGLNLNHPGAILRRWKKSKAPEVASQQDKAAADHNDDASEESDGQAKTTPTTLKEEVARLTDENNKLAKASVDLHQENMWLQEENGSIPHLKEEVARL